MSIDEWACSGRQRRKDQFRVLSQSLLKQHMTPGVVDDEHDGVDEVRLEVVAAAQEGDGGAEELVELSLEDGGDDRRLVTNVLVDRRTRDAGALGDHGVEASVKPFGQQALGRGVEDAFTDPLGGMGIRGTRPERSDAGHAGIVRRSTYSLTNDRKM